MKFFAVFAFVLIAFAAVAAGSMSQETKAVLTALQTYANAVEAGISKASNDLKTVIAKVVKASAKTANTLATDAEHAFNTAKANVEAAPQEIAQKLHQLEKNNGIIGRIDKWF